MRTLTATLPEQWTRIKADYRRGCFHSIRREGRSNRGSLPEIEEYRGDRIRSRGEMISETGKIGRAIEKRPELLQEEDTGESPILTGVKRIALGAERFGGLMGNASAAPTLMPTSTPAASMSFSPEPPDFEAETGDTTRLDANFATGDRVDPAPDATSGIAPTTAPIADTGNVNALIEFAPAVGIAGTQPDGPLDVGDAALSPELAERGDAALTPAGPFDGEEELFLGSLIAEDEMLKGKSDDPEDPDGSLGRIADAAGTAVSGLFEGPLGIPRESLGSLANQSSEDMQVPVAGLIRAFNEVLIRGGALVGDVALRSLAAPVVGGIEAAVQTAQELGMSRTDARKLRRDLYMSAEVSAAAAPTVPLRPRVGRAPSVALPVKRGSLIDQTADTGTLGNALKNLPPERRKAVQEQLNRSFDEGQRAAKRELGRLDLDGAGQAANPPETIKRNIRNLVDFVNKFGEGRSSRVKPKRVWFGRVDGTRAQELQDQLKDDFGVDFDLRGAVHRIEEDAVTHILRKHRSDQVPFTAEDLELIPEIVETGRVISTKKTHTWA